MSDRCCPAWWPAPGSSLSWTQCFPAAWRSSTPSGYLKHSHVRVSGTSGLAHRTLAKWSQDRWYRFSPRRWSPWSSLPPWSLRTSHRPAGRWSERDPRSGSGNCRKAPEEAPLKDIHERQWRCEHVAAKRGRPAGRGMADWASTHRAVCPGLRQSCSRRCEKLFLSLLVWYSETSPASLRVLVFRE